MIRGDTHLNVIADDAARFHVCQSPLTLRALRIFVPVTVVMALAAPLVATSLSSPRPLLILPALGIAGAGYLIARRTGEIIIDRDRGVLVSRVRRWAFVEDTRSMHRDRLLAVRLEGRDPGPFDVWVRPRAGEEYRVARSVGPDLARAIASHAATTLGLAVEGSPPPAGA